MADTKLLGILQISDLHFGSLNPADDRRLVDLLDYLPFLSGMLGHGDAAVDDLYRFYKAQKAGDPSLRLVVSGDLTRTGAVDQFALAADFLGQSRGAAGFGFGLGEADWRDTSVSGNHDQWSGASRPCGGPTAGLSQCLSRSYPAVGPLERLSGGISIRFISVDSDADVLPHSADRVLARGGFWSQIDALDRQPPDPLKNGEIRVLVVHHAIQASDSPASHLPEAFPSRTPGNPFACLEIEPASLLRLRQALMRHGIRVVMTGHVHSPRLTDFAIRDGGSAFRVLETRCGSTTQRDAYPRSMQLVLKALGRPTTVSLSPNSLVLHALLQRGDEFVWRSEVYTRVDPFGFLGPSSTHAQSAQRRTERQLSREFVL